MSTKYLRINWHAAPWQNTWELKSGRPRHSRGAERPDGRSAKNAKNRQTPPSPPPPPYAAPRSKRHSLHCAYPTVANWKECPQTPAMNEFEALPLGRPYHDELHLRHPNRPVIQRSLFLWSYSHSWDTSITFFIFHLQDLFFNLLIKLLNFGLITSLTFLLLVNPLPLPPNRSLLSPSNSPRTTRWGSRGIQGHQILKAPFLKELALVLLQKK